MSRFSGLDSLGGFAPQSPADSKALTVPVTSIHPGRVQYRLHFDDSETQELADVFRQHGFRGAVWVEPGSKPNQYLLISGERRWRAAKLAGLKEIPVELITDLSEAAIAEIGYLANSASKALNLVEDTRAVLDLLARSLGVSHEDAKRALYKLNNAAVATKSKSNQSGLISPSQSSPSKSNQSGLIKPGDQELLSQVESVFDRIKAGDWKNFVRNRLPLLNLPAEVMEAVEAGTLDGTKAQLIGRIKDEDVRSAVLQDVISNQLSKREIQRLIKELAPPAKDEKPPELKQYQGLLKKLPGALADPDKAIRVRALLGELNDLLS